MSLSAFVHGFLVWLLEPAVRVLAVASLAAVALPLFRLTGSRSRLAVWTMVLYIALTMPFLGRVLPDIPVALPLPAAVVIPQATRAVGMMSSAPAVGAAPVGEVPEDARSGLPQPRSATSVDAAILTWPDEPLAIAFARRVAAISWPAVGLGLYALIALALLVRLPIGIALSRRLVRAARPIDDVHVLERVRTCAESAGLARAPALGESVHLAVPATLGIRRPVVLLPPDWRRWDPRDLDAILVHELSHVARGDALTQQLALLHRAVFWFSPLSWWLTRHLIDLAEQASDDAALAAGADSTRYAGTLVEFLKQVNAAPPRIRWQGVSMAKAGRAERRVDRILAWTGGGDMRKSSLLMVALVSVPVVVALATVRPVAAQTNLPPAPPAPARVPGPPPVPVATVPARPPQPPPIVAPPPPPPPTEMDSADHVFGNVRGDDGPRFVLVPASGDDVIMSGTREDARHARELRAKIDGAFLWFQQDERSYIITDPATIARVQDLFAPIEELGRQQEALGRQQEALGTQQAALGRQMQDVRVKLPDLSNDLARIKQQIDAMNAAGATQDEIGRLQSAVGRLQSRIGSYQSDAGSRQGEIGEKQGELGRQQGDLGRQQGALGREQARQSRMAHDKLRTLLADAVRSGLAKPE